MQMQEIETIEQLADAIVENTDFYDPRSLLSLQQQKEKLRGEVLEALDLKDVSVRLQNALKILMGDGASLLSREEKEQMRVDLNKMASGATKWEETTQDLQHALGVSRVSMQLWHRIANDQYQRGLYEQAGDIFTLLTVLNPFVEIFWIGLGGSNQMSKQYQEALNAYEMALDVNDNNALTFLVRCECYLNLDKRTEAEEAWNRAKMLMDTEEKQPTLENLANALQTKLNQARS